MAKGIGRVHLVLRAIKPLVPRALREFYTELRRDYVLKDRSEVVLYAHLATLPGYHPRIDPSAGFDVG